jgi:hypothetical protein
MADSTTSTDNQFLSSWNSCETLAEEDLLHMHLFCYICKEQLGDEGLSQAVNGITPGQCIIFNSIVVLTCEDCPQLAHLHCRMNLPHIVYQDLIENPPPSRCTDCSQHVEEENSEANEDIQ